MYRQLKLRKLIFVENIPYEKDIEWWNINRRKLNNLIDMYNKLAVKPSRLGVEELLFKIDWMLKVDKDMGDKSFTEWQIELINELRQLTKLEFSEYIN